MFTFMATRRGPKEPDVHLFIKEHMVVLDVSDEALAERIGVARETVWRWHKQQNRLRPAKIKRIAQALGLQFEDLFHPPHAPIAQSLDALLKDADEPTKKLAFDIVSRLTNRLT